MNSFTNPFSWDAVIDLVEKDNTGIVVHEYENEVEFDIPDYSYSFYVDPKEITTWNDLAKEIQERYEDFDPEEYVLGWLEAKKSGTRNVPDVFTLVENAEDINEFLDDLVILLAKCRTD